MSIPAASRLGGEPVSKVEILVSCSHLLNKDVTSKSDPCCLLEMMTAGSWMELGRTENVKNSLSPQFSKSFQVDYYFEEVQKLRFSIYDIDNKTYQLSDDDFLGMLECTLGEVVSGSPYTKPLMLRGNKKAGQGTITIRAQEVGNSRDCLVMQFCAKNLDNKDFMGKSDPYLEFSRRMPDGGYQVVCRTEVVKNELNPRWRPVEIDANRLCGNDNRTSIKVECNDYSSDGSHDFIGSFETTVEELMQGVNKELQWPCNNPKKRAKKKNYLNSGVVYLTSCKVTKVHTFLDYIFGGLQINFTVGIDFTASNGHPNNPTSLHFIHPSQPNHYMRAIHSVGQVIQDYDSDQMFPALGYGAKIPPAYQVSHVFALNFNAANPFCAGIQGVMDAYRLCLSQVQLHGPTNFAPIIYHVAQFALSAQKERAAKNYFILLIITDGVISDLADTVRAIVYASTLPLSLIIVGVGSADFSAMDVLDGDNGVLRDNSGNICRRDIVQFVPFRQFENASPAALAKQVLAEIPGQVVGYFKMNGIAPSLPGSKVPGQGPYQSNPTVPGGQTQHSGGVPTSFVQAVGGQQSFYPSVPVGGAGHFQGGQAPYLQDQQMAGQGPNPPQGQQPGRTNPYLSGGQVPYPQSQQAGSQAPYPPQSQQPGGTSPYPPQSQQPGATSPYPPQSQQPGGTSPYPPGQQPGGQVSYTSGQAGVSYPFQGQQIGTTSPYSQDQLPVGGQGPYPPQWQQVGQGSNPTSGQAPHPSPQQPYQAGGLGPYQTPPGPNAYQRPAVPPTTYNQP